MIKKVAVGTLRIGVYVDRLDRDWEGTPFLFEGFTISSESELSDLVSFCTTVNIDTSRGLDVLYDIDGASDTHISEDEIDIELDIEALDQIELPDSNIDTFGSSEYHVHQKDLQEHLLLSKGARQTVTEFLHHALNDASKNRSIDIIGAMDAVKPLVKDILQPSHFQHWLTRTNKRHEYTLNHSVNVCVLSIIFGQYLGYTTEQLYELGTAALLHDIGKMQLSEELLNKPEKLSNLELAEIKTHTRKGYDLLRNSRDPVESISDVAYCHHEKIDGTGYPNHLSGIKISEFVRLVAIVDSYDGLISHRSYQNAVDSPTALNWVYNNRGSSFDKRMVNSFIKCIGVNPPGSIVELNSGQIALVIRIDDHMNKPSVLIVRDRDHQRYKKARLLDIAEAESAYQTPPNIAKTLAVNAYGIHVERYADFDYSDEYINYST